MYNNIIPLHGRLQQLYNVIVVVTPGDVQGRPQSTQSQLVGKVDNDLDTFEMSVVTGIVDGEPGGGISNGGVSSSTAWEEEGGNSCQVSSYTHSSEGSSTTNPKPRRTILCLLRHTCTLGWVGYKDRGGSRGEVSGVVTPPPNAHSPHLQYYYAVLFIGVGTFLKVGVLILCARKILAPPIINSKQSSRTLSVSGCTR